MEIFPMTEGGPYQLFPTAMGSTYVLFPATLLNFVKAQKSPPISRTQQQQQPSGRSSFETHLGHRIAPGGEAAANS